MGTPRDASYFITGFPGFIGRRLVQHLVKEAPTAHVYLLVQASALPQAKEALAELHTDRVELLTGDIQDMHLGLSGEEYHRLTGKVTDVFHLAAVSSFEVTRETAWRVNVDGTRNVLEFAGDCAQLVRFNHFSSCYVAGDRVGVIAEDELDCDQGFHNVYEETKYHAERLVQRAASRLPISIYRPSAVVGDSHTGAIDRFEGPYYLSLLLVLSPLISPLPLPGGGAAPLNVVPVDFIVRATWALSQDPRAVGKTFHLVDPHPMSTRRAYERIARKTNKRTPKFSLSARAADVVMGLPLVERWVRPQRTALHYVNHLAIYTSRNTSELLDGTGIRCPSLPDYLDVLVAYAREHARRRRDVEPDDPLDRPFPAPSQQGP